MTEHISPFLHPESGTNNFQMFLDAFKKILFKEISVCFPVIVKEYDRKTHKILVQPAAYEKLSLGQIVEQGEFWTTAWRFRCGGFVIDIPIKEGDTGWVICSDCDTTVIKANSNYASPLVSTRNIPDAGLFIPDSWRELELGENTENRLTIQAVDGSSKISMGEGEIKVYSTTKISVESNTIEAKATTINIDSEDTINVNAENSIAINSNAKSISVTGLESVNIEGSNINLEGSNINLTGVMTFTGDSTFTGGDSTFTGAIKCNNVQGEPVDLTNHYHYNNTKSNVNSRPQNR